MFSSYKGNIKQAKGILSYDFIYFEREKNLSFSTTKKKKKKNNNNKKIKK